MQEAVFYHALNVAAKGEYRALYKLRRICEGKAWKDVWRQRAGRLVPDAYAAAEEAWAALGRAGIGLALAGGPDYPGLLSHIPHPPFGLYLRGNAETAAADKSPAGTAVAIVGTRKAGAGGRALAHKFAAALARAGCIIVSGLAFGIDAAAHAGALEARGRTVAVLANGLDRAYPSSNRRLAERIVKSGGALVSEYPPGAPPLGHRFLERNRIISGLSQAVLIIEAPEHSGALATARFAMEQDRDLFVAPGAAENLNYRGSHRLIREGATLVTEPDEMLEDMGFAAAAGPAKHAADTPEEEKVLAALAAAERPLTIDEIIEAATLTSSIVNRTLTVLVLKNAVREEGGRYAIK